MPSPLITCLPFTLIAYLMYLLTKYRDRAIGTNKRKDPNFSDIPGWPLIGQIPDIIFNISNPLELGITRHLKFRPGWSVTMPGLRLIDISKPEWLEYVQKTNFSNYVKGSVFHSVMTDVFGHGIFVTDGPRWKKSRQTAASLFTITSFRKCIAPSIRRSVDLLLEGMDLAAEGGMTLDLRDLLLKFTLDTIMYTTIGKDMGQLRKIPLSAEAEGFEKSPETSFVNAFDFAQNQLDLRFSIMTIWKAYEAFNFPLGKQMNSACQTIHKYISCLIDKRLTEIYNNPSAEGEDEVHMDLMAFYVRSRDKLNGKVCSEDLKDAILNLMLAGRDTTGESISWAFYHLLADKDLIMKIREEARTITGNNEHAQVTYENHKKFNWTHAVILETLRLHPSVPKNVRFALTADQIPGGPMIEAGDGVRWSDWAMGRDAEIWGKDCHEFKPSRWFDELGNMKQAGQFKFHAFNGGPRVCLGMNFAIFQSVSLIVEVLHNFDLEFAPGWLEKIPKPSSFGNAKGKDRTPQYKPSLTLKMAYPMMVCIKRHEPND